MFVQKKKLVEHVLAMRGDGGSSDEEEEEEDQGDILQVPAIWRERTNYLLAVSSVLQSNHCRMLP